MVTGGILPTGSVLLNVGLPCHYSWKAFLFSSSIGAENTADNVPYSFFSLWPPPHVWVGHLWVTSCLIYQGKYSSRKWWGRVYLAPFLMSKPRGASAPHPLVQRSYQGRAPFRFGVSFFTWALKGFFVSSWHFVNIWNMLS